MPIDFNYDVEKDSFYLRGVEKGVNIGISKSAWKMFKAGYSIKVIAETLELTTQQVTEHIKEWEAKS